MTTPRERFLAHVESPEADETVDELRTNLVKLKLEAIEQHEKLDDEGLRLVMPGLYEQIVVTEVQMAGHVGLGVCLALVAHDEHRSNASLSRFSRPVREHVTEMGVSLKKRHSSRLAKMVAEIEAQRLALRHSHEFMSWLAFRRDDERYPANDRLERLKAFKIDQRLLNSREVLIRLLGLRLATAIEGTDRFLLANRWRLADAPEHAIERLVWPLLSYQTRAGVLVEHARWTYDTLVDGGATSADLDRANHEIGVLMRDQMAESLDYLPSIADSGAF